MILNFRSLSFVILFLAISVLPGCGRKTALIPPQDMVPEAVKDLQYSLDQNGVNLQWSYPVKMANGEPLTVIESFEVFRAEIPGNEFCEGCPVRFTNLVLIDGGQLPSEDKGRTATYSDTGLRNGYHYMYKVRARGGRWFSGKDSNVVSFLWGELLK
jgi:hypothetical protein